MYQSKRINILESSTTSTTSTLSSSSLSTIVQSSEIRYTKSKGGRGRRFRNRRDIYEYVPKQKNITLPNYLQNIILSQFQNDFIEINGWGYDREMIIPLVFVCKYWAKVVSLLISRKISLCMLDNLVTQQRHHLPYHFALGSLVDLTNIRHLFVCSILIFKIYDYYGHTYPQQQRDVHNLNKGIKEMVQLERITLTGNVEDTKNAQQYIFDLIKDLNNDVQLDCCLIVNLHLPIEYYELIDDNSDLDEPGSDQNYGEDYDQFELIPPNKEEEEKVKLKVEHIIIQNPNINLDLEFRILKTYKPRKVTITQTNHGRHFDYSQLFQMDFIQDLFISDDYVEFKDINIGLNQPSSSSSLSIISPQSSLTTLSIKLPFHFYSFEIKKERRDKMRDNPCSFRFGLPQYSQDYNPHTTIETFVNLLLTNTTLTDLSLHSICKKDHRRAGFFRQCKLLVDCFGELLHRNRTIRHLGLFEIDFLDSRFFESIAKCSLERLTFYSPITSDCLVELYKSLSINRSLRRIDLRLSGYSNSSDLTQLEGVIRKLKAIPNRTTVICIFDGYKYISF